MLDRPALHAGGRSLFESSFPSGHAARSVLVAALVVTLWRRAGAALLAWLAVALVALGVRAGARRRPTSPAASACEEAAVCGGGGVGCGRGLPRRGGGGDCGRSLRSAEVGQATTVRRPGRGDLAALLVRLEAGELGDPLARARPTSRAAGRAARARAGAGAAARAAAARRGRRPASRARVDGRAVKSLAADLYTEGAGRARGAAIDELVLRARDLPHVRDAALFLAADVELAWRLFALALLAEELADDIVRGIRGPRRRACRSGLARVTRGICGASAVPRSPSSSPRSRSPFAGASQLIDRNAVRASRSASTRRARRSSPTAPPAGRARARVGRGQRRRARPTARPDWAQARLRRRLGQVLRGRPGCRRCRRNTSGSSARPAYLTSPTVKQLSAKSAFARNYATTSFGGSCPHYDGPALAWIVTACKAPDGSYWAVQTLAARAAELRPRRRTRRSPSGSSTSRTGRRDLPVLTIHDRLVVAPVGSPLRHVHLPTAAGLRLRARPPTGQPLDAFGRNLYVDTLDSAYGTGWKRENSFLTHKGDGRLLLQRQPARRAPRRATARSTARRSIGPGVTPDVMWEGAPPGAYDKADASSTCDRALHDNSAVRTDGSTPREASRRDATLEHERR